MKIAKVYALAELRSVTKLSEMRYDEWCWREEHVGSRGELFVLVSSKSAAHRLYFTDHDGGYLTTSYGAYTVNGNSLVLTTKNTRYEFEILQE